MYSRVVTSFKKSMRLFISCVKPDADKDSSEEAWRREEMMFVSSNSSQETLGPWREVSASQTEELQKEEIPLVGVEEGGEAKGKDVASLVAPADNDSPITSVQQNDQTHTVHYFQTRFGRFILERHRQIRATLHCPLLPPVDAADVGKKCLVLDLDETLIHSQFAAVESPDLEVPIELDSGVIKPIYVCKRPGVDEFLAAVGQHFEVVIFTASLASYADPVIDFLDKTKTIKHRLYRDSCVFIDGLYLKDLSRLGRPLEQITLIDNAPMSYMLQPQNGVAIVSWFADRNDEELLGRMLPALHSLRLAPDVYSWKKTNTHLISE
jgi:RNA polymerase II subunit A small phosphatase-like protein